MGLLDTTLARLVVFTERRGIIMFGVTDLSCMLQSATATCSLRQLSHTQSHEKYSSSFSAIMTAKNTHKNMSVHNKNTRKRKPKLHTIEN